MLTSKRSTLTAGMYLRAVSRGCAARLSCASEPRLSLPSSGASPGYRRAVSRRGTSDYGKGRRARSYARWRHPAVPVSTSMTVTSAHRLTRASVTRHAVRARTQTHTAAYSSFLRSDHWSTTFSRPLGMDSPTFSHGAGNPAHDRLHSHPRRVADDDGDRSHPAPPPCRPPLLRPCHLVVPVPALARAATCPEGEADTDEGYHGPAVYGDWVSHDRPRIQDFLYLLKCGPW